LVSLRVVTSVITSALRVWLPIAAAITILAGFGYGLVQQDIRTSANDPQWQMAEDAASALAADPGAVVVAPAKVDMSRSLAPYLITFDLHGTITAASVELGGTTPSPPIGSLTAARTTGAPNSFTWQPTHDPPSAPSVRQAAVVVAYKGGYVLGGRSMRLVDEREAAIERLAIAGWLAALVGSAAMTLAATWLLRSPGLLRGGRRVA
jgi:hypothetical protein